MKLLAQIGSQPVRRVVQFRAKPAAALLTAIEEAVLSEEVHAGVVVAILSIAPDEVMAAKDPDTQTHDIFLAPT
ncbi:MAG: hypothetical protein JJV98_08400 [Desulfosarcina sp.]|nr:hypothetical protein [Desulfobacterales bacterium]